MSISTALFGYVANCCNAGNILFNFCTGSVSVSVSGSGSGSGSGFCSSSVTGVGVTMAGIGSVIDWGRRVLITCFSSSLSAADKRPIGMVSNNSSIEACG